MGELQMRYWVMRRLLLIEAAIYLIFARFALKLFSFRSLCLFFNRPVRQREVTGEKRKLIRKNVAWAIRSMIKQLPGETVCFPRSIAAQAMLRRHGISATLCYGAKKLNERGLTAHTWVMDGEEGVVGYRLAHQYHILARYPDGTGAIKK
jgi:hypothetical protein